MASHAFAIVKILTRVLSLAIGPQLLSREFNKIISIASDILLPRCDFLINFQNMIHYVLVVEIEQVSLNPQQATMAHPVLLFVKITSCSEIALVCDPLATPRDLDKQKRNAEAFLHLNNSCPKSR